MDEIVQDADFAVDLTYSKSTSEGVLCKFGGHTFEPSHSSTEAEVMACDSGLRLDVSRALRLRDAKAGVLGRPVSRARGDLWRQLEPETLGASMASSDTATTNMTDVAPLSSLRFFQSLEASSFNGSRNLTIPPPVTWSTKFRLSQCRTTHSLSKAHLLFSVARGTKVVFRIFCGTFIFSVFL